jgi:hypothetical protein
MRFVWPQIDELGVKVGYYCRIAEAIAAASSTALYSFGDCGAQHDIVEG